MREYIYEKKEIEFIQHLLNNTPNKIWYNLVYYVFDYGNYHLILECVDRMAKSQNKSDEAIISELTLKEKEFKPSEHTELICENRKIDNIYIVRTFLYFSTYRNYNNFEKFVNRIRHKLKTIIRGKENKIDKLISNSTGVGAEIICHPKSQEAKKVDKEFSNLLDVGLLVEINGKFLRAFLQSNGFGFHIWKKKYFYEPNELEDDTELYEFIKIEQEKTFDNKS